MITAVRLMTERALFHYLSGKATPADVAFMVRGGENDTDELNHPFWDIKLLTGFSDQGSLLPSVWL